MDIRIALGRRRREKAPAPEAETFAGASEGATEQAPQSPTEEAVQSAWTREEADLFTLGTMCLCGHRRGDHRGLQLQARGACWECGCTEFTSVDALTPDEARLAERVREALERLERLEGTMSELVSRARARNGRARPDDSSR